jgi:hypothetical protein
MAVGPGRAGVQTYDLSVRGAQEFVVNGLLVHNSAEIAFGDPEDEAFRELKNPLVAGDALLHHRWSSNNSIFAKVGMDYTEAAARTAVNGEPGFEWLANAQAYSRMGREPDHRDRKAAGGNPCIVGSTRIAVADGRHAVPIKQLVDEGKDVPVYSLDPTTGQMSVKWARNPRLTRKDASLVRVHLDDGTHVDCTPEHKWYLRDCTWKEAKDLLPGDSLSTFSKKQEVMTSGGNKYWQVETNTADPHAARSRVMEHRLIAKFCDPDTFNAKHSLEKHNGWVNGGLVVHHKNYNSLDNSPSNLQWMTFTEHTKHHADFDRVGENNGMFGREHSEETKRKIGDKTLERTQSAEFCAKLSASHTLEERSELSVRMTEQKAEWDKAYYLEQEAQTDLDTVWVGEQMFARKVCELCTTSFVVPWGKRDRVHCSTRCSQLWLAGMDKRKNNQRQYFADKQKSTLHDQVMVFKDLEKSQGSVPLKKAWAGACREKGVSFRLRPEGSESNTSVLRSFGHLKEVAAGYNDRVAHVEILSHVADVYCLTVDDNHTMSIIPEGRDTAKCLKSLNISNCLEQTLEDRELCCLVETFPSLHENYEDYEKTLKYAYLYAKSVTLVPTHDERTNMVMQRNRRIGASMSGIVQAMQRHGTRNFLNMCDQGYSYLRSLDESYSDWLCVRQSIKITSVKPSGTVSLLAGVTPGIHYPHSKFYIRRIRFQANSPLVSLLEQCGHKTELDQYSPNTVCVEFPIKEEYFDRGKDEVSMWEQLELAAQIQHYWADNQVSVTVTFKAEEASAIKRALELYETRLKGVSFLPIKDHGYVQAPMETITEEQYNAMAAKLRPMLSLDAVTNEVVERFCDGDVCVVQ